MKWFSRVILGLMIASAALLLAFGPRPNETVPPGRVVVSYWEKWTADEAAAMKVIVDNFNNSVGAEKNIYVQYVALASVDRKTLTATAAGVPPDVAGLWLRDVVSNGARNSLMPLEDFAAEHGINASQYKKVYWDPLNYEGHLYALPSTPAAVALHYNKRFMYESADKLRALGLDPTRPPRTLEEFDRYAEALDTRDPKTNRIDRAGYYTMEPGWWIIYTPFWFGGSLFDKPLGRYKLDTPANIRAFEWVASYSKRMGKDSLTDFKSGLGQPTTPQSAFFCGRVAMCQQGPWTANYIRNNAPDMSQALVPFALEPFLPRVLRPFNYEWAAAAFPSALPGLEDVTVCDQDVLMIPRGAKHPAEAFEFIAYVQRQDVMEKLCQSHCKNSPLAKQSDDWVYTHPNPFIDVFDRLAASPNATTSVLTPITSAAHGEIDVAANRCYLLTDTPQSALRKAQVRVDVLWDQYLKHRAMRK